MVRRFLNLMVALGLVAVGVVVAARVAEPSIRPVLYPPSASPRRDIDCATASTAARIAACSAVSGNTTRAAGTGTPAALWLAMSSGSYLASRSPPPSPSPAAHPAPGLSPLCSPRRAADLLLLRTFLLQLLLLSPVLHEELHHRLFVLFRVFV